jgi:hypothetical protein
MHVLLREEVIGRRIVDIIISVPDKPVTMSDMSYSPGYLKLDSGFVFDLSVQPLCVADDSVVTRVTRDARYECEFSALLLQDIENVVSMVDDGCLCVVTSAAVITVVPAQFWVRPCIYKRAEFTYKTEPYWT